MQCIDSVGQALQVSHNQLSTTLNEEPFNDLSLLLIHCPSHLFLSKNTKRCTQITSHEVTVGRTKFKNFSLVGIGSVRTNPVCLW